MPSEMKCSEAEGKVKHVRNVQDLEDELEEYREKLSKAEKSLGRYGNLLRLFKGGPIWLDECGTH